MAAYRRTTELMRQTLVRTVNIWPVPGEWLGSLEQRGGLEWQSDLHISCPVDAGTSLRPWNQFESPPRSTKATSTVWRRDPPASVILSEPERWRFLSACLPDDYSVQPKPKHPSSE